MEEASLRACVLALLLVPAKASWEGVPERKALVGGLGSEQKGRNVELGERDTASGLLISEQL